MWLFETPQHLFAVPFCLYAVFLRVFTLFEGNAGLGSQGLRGAGAGMCGAAAAIRQRQQLQP